MPHHHPPALQAAPGQRPGSSPGTNSPPDCLCPGSALANERVQTNAAGQVVLKLKTPWRDGTTHLVMSPLDFMQRLAARAIEERPSTKSVYLTPRQSWSSAPTLVASDRPRWTEPPLGGGTYGCWGM